MAASRVSYLAYKGRGYTGFYGGRDGAGLRLDRPIGKTFSLWQSGGQFPAGTDIYGVAGRPVEELVGVAPRRGRSEPLFFHADDRFSGPDTIQVALGMVVSVGPERWTTPDGQRPPERRQPAGTSLRPEDGNAIYTPATIAVERVLQGRIPADDREIEVRQWGGIDGQFGVAISGGRPVTLTPGARVILFLYPGQWSDTWYGRVPAGDHYWLASEGAYTVEGERVTPLDAPGTLAAGVSLDDFLAGLAETFQGVQSLDPHGPRPTPVGPLPTPTAMPPIAPPYRTATRRASTNQAVNPVREYGLGRTKYVMLKGGVVPGVATRVDDAGRIRAILAALDRPLPVQVAATPYPRAGLEDVVYVTFLLDRGEPNLFEYNHKAGTLTSLVDRAAPFTVTAPPDFLRVLGLE